MKLHNLGTVLGFEVRRTLTKPSFWLTSLSIPLLMVVIFALMFWSNASALSSVDTQRGEICPMAMHVAFLYIDILRYGGSIPGQNPGEAIFSCPDADTLNIFKVEVVQGESLLP